MPTVAAAPIRKRNQDLTLDRNAEGALGWVPDRSQRPDLLKNAKGKHKIENNTEVETKRKNTSNQIQVPPTPTSSISQDITAPDIENTDTVVIDGDTQEPHHRTQVCDDYSESTVQDREENDIRSIPTGPLPCIDQSAGDKILEVDNVEDYIGQMSTSTQNFFQLCHTVFRTEILQPLSLQFLYLYKKNTDVVVHVQHM